MIGGGLAGSALATALALAGRSVYLIEKEPGPHDKVCGEFLSREALHYLSALGIDVAALGGVPIHTVRLVSRRASIPQRLPFPAMSFSRRCLDAVLLHRAEQAGALLLSGQRVEQLSRNGDCWTARLQDDSEHHARAAFLASGKHDLRGWKRPPGKQGDLIAFKMYWRLAPRETAELAGAVELLLFPSGYGGLEPVEGGIANLCLLVRRGEFERLGSRWPALLESMRAALPHLDRRLTGAEPLLERPLALSSIPYGYIRPAVSKDATEKLVEAALWSLGDQAAVIPSFSGDGMSIALHSAALAASIYLAGGEAAGFQARLGHDVKRQVALATFLSRRLVSPRAQGWLSGARFVPHAIPGMLSLIARATRIPERRLL